MSKRDVDPIVNGRVRLRVLEENDLPMTLAWRNQDHIRQWFFTSDVITPASHHAWFTRYRERDDDFVFVIDETETLRRPVGQAALYRVDWNAGRAEFGRLMIGDAGARGLGLGQLATEALTELALKRWRLGEVCLEVLDTNAIAIGIYQRCGFAVTDRRNGSVHMTLRGSSWRPR